MEHTFNCVIFAIRFFSEFCSFITFAKLHANTTPRSSKKERTAPEAANAISRGIIWSCKKIKICILLYFNRSFARWLLDVIMSLGKLTWQYSLYYPKYYFHRADTSIQIYFRCDAPNELVSIKSSQVSFENVRAAVFIIPDQKW